MAYEIRPRFRPSRLGSRSLGQASARRARSASHAPLPSRVTRTPRLPRACPRSPEKCKKKKITPVLQVINQ